MLQYRTIAGERPQGKPNVYFSCHPEDFELYFEEYAVKILRIQECAVWYETEPEADWDREDLALDLSQMQLFVVPVTTRLLKKSCRAMDFELSLAKEKHIPVLPLMMEKGLDQLFSKRFGDLQYLDPSERDETRRSFDEVLSSYIRSVLVSDELAKRIRAAFDACIFLSYRREDRRKAQELMRLIHKDPMARDIAIWYDEFLTPGEDFNAAIGDMLEKSDIFAMVVTPNLVNESNYVMTTEYPEARKRNKPIIPVEMEKTDRKALEEHYASIPACVPGREEDSLRSLLQSTLMDLAISLKEESPEHNYLIGMAYLDGICVEANADRALELIAGAAHEGVPEAMEQMVTMYETGKGVARDYHEGIWWRRVLAERLRSAYESEKTEENADRLLSHLFLLGIAQYNVRDLDAARETLLEKLRLVQDLVDSGKSRYRRELAVCYKILGDIAVKAGQLNKARKWYQKDLAVSEELARESGTARAKKDLSTSYRNGGDIAMEVGDFPEAKVMYEKCIAVCEELMRQLGGSFPREYLSACYMRLGDLARVARDFSGAGIWYGKSRVMYEELVRETGEVIARGNLSICYSRLGDLARETGNLPEAMEWYEKNMALNEELAMETGTIDSRGSLSISYERMGTIAMETENYSLAMAWYEKCLKIRRELVKETGTAESRHGLHICYMWMGDAAMRSGDLSGASGWYMKGLDLIEELAWEMRNAGFYRELAIAYHRLGDLAAKKGEVSKALEWYEKDISLCEKLDRLVNVIISKRDLAVRYFDLGSFHEHYTRERARAKACYRRAMEIGRGSSDGILAEVYRRAGKRLEEDF